MDHFANEVVAWPDPSLVKGAAQGAVKGAVENLVDDLELIQHGIKGLLTPPRLMPKLALVYGKEGVEVLVSDEGPSDKGKLSLENKGRLSLEINFLNLLLEFKSQKRNASDLLIKATGKPKDSGVLWDLTAGWGKEALLLARQGYNVVSFERIPWLSWCLQYSLKRARLNLSTKGKQDDTTKGKQDDFTHMVSTLERVQFFHADSFDLLQDHAPDELSPLYGVPEVIYLDPMYPSKKKSALSSKWMQILQAVTKKALSTDTMLEQVVTRARLFAQKSVVLKRPHDAPKLDLLNQRELKGKLVRYDIFRGVNP